MPVNHHGSHRDLLRSATPDSRAEVPPVNAIIVPVAHRVDLLRNAMTLALKLSCPLVTLCSQGATAAEARKLAGPIGADVVAIDMDRLPAESLPSFETTALLRDTPFAHLRDTGAKRNLGLLLARLRKWRRIVFLDADITVPEPGDLWHAARLLDDHTAVGLEIIEYPDNSVVCHAHRATGGDQRSFIGGGALAVDPTKASSFFPDIYNEDWFFLLDGDRLSPVAVTGTARQQRYDPYVSADRAANEEFGDSLAEGLFWLLDEGRGVDDATVDYWRTFLELRQSFIDDIIERVEQAPELPAARDAMITALTAARRRHEQISPTLCTDYLAAWKRDVTLWGAHVDEWCANKGGQYEQLSELMSDKSLTIT